MQNPEQETRMKFSYRKTFLLGLGFFGVSVIWVPIFLANKLGLASAGD